MKIPSKYRSWKWKGKRANLRKKSNGGKGFHIVATHPDSEAGSDYMTSEMTLKKIGILLCSIWNVESFDCRDFLSFFRSAVLMPSLYLITSIFHMKRPKIKTQSLEYLATAEICVMVGSSSPLEESFSAIPDGWGLATLVFGLLFSLTLPVHPCEICFTWVNGH